MLADEVGAAARRARDRLARPRLTAATAQLYSQHVRLAAGQPPLATFLSSDIDERLLDAVRLVETAFVDRESGTEGWRASLRRAGELLEWLAHPDLNGHGLPLTMLGAAAYQLAEYPARAASLAREARPTESESPLLRLFVTGRFRDLLPMAVDEASLRSSFAARREDGGGDATAAYRDLVVSEVASALGVLSAELRWGGERRADLALAKLEAASAAVTHLVDPFSWLLVRLSAAFAQRAVATSLRASVAPLSQRMSGDGQQALDRYVRLAFASNQALSWPSQRRGLDKLVEGGSFALCTPTGSGKTRVAEVALLDGLLAEEDGEEERPLCLYIVPSRALASEVEGKLGFALRNISHTRALTVTGLYGGTDWGPTDDFLSSEDPTVLICTQEKAEALVRFAGSLFLDRLNLVIVDEAHAVQSRDSVRQLEDYESRALRLETLVSRLRARRSSARFIAISAVARHLERPLAQWISGGAETDAVSVPYRSTRQVVGRLQCRNNGQFRIEYDLLDGEPLEVASRGVDAPFVPAPFPPMPAADRLSGPKQQPATRALWAAMNLASARGEVARPQSVLVSVTEGIDHFAGWWLELLEDDWSAAPLPTFFESPTDDSARELFDRAANTCADLFGDDSREHRLLKLGIVVHHGRMPGRLPRLLIDIVEAGIVRVVLATSTLSEGVNLPFGTVLIPALTRWDETAKRLRRISGREFGNLIGRAGRPGVATEGQALVLQVETQEAWRRRRDRQDYDAVIREVAGTIEDSPGASSALAHLLIELRRAWSGDDDSFVTWLEQTAPVEVDEDSATGGVKLLDSLDAVLLAVLEEGIDDAAEERITRFWRESFARYASAEERQLENVFLTRGRALPHIYPEDNQRRRFYRSSLPPRDAQALELVVPRLLEHLKTGEGYALWSEQERFAYLAGTVEIVNDVPRFKVREKVGRSRKATWRDALAWWLRIPDWDGPKPSITQVASWHSYLQNEVRYRFTWGLGSTLVMALEDAGIHAGTDWRAAGVPWAAIWMKDLVTWGTTNPAAAYLLARGISVVRDDAEGLGREYLEEPPEGLDPLDPSRIRHWAVQLAPRRERAPAETRRFEVTVSQRFLSATPRKWRVIPVARDGDLVWLDAAGVALGKSPLPEDWRDDAATRLDFSLTVDDAVVTAVPYV